MSLLSFDDYIQKKEKIVTVRISLSVKLIEQINMICKKKKITFNEFVKIAIEEHIIYKKRRI